MGRTVNASFRGADLWLRVALARAHQIIGWAGIGGVAVSVAALWAFALAASEQHAFTNSKLSNSKPASNAAKSLAAAPMPMPVEIIDPPRTSPQLPHIADLPLLLTQMEKAALANGLAWRAADYKSVGASLTKPASLEVRCIIKGTYPQLRRMLVRLMNEIPAFTIREFNLSRPSGDSVEVEAKLVLAVFLQDGASDSVAPTKPVP